MARGTGSGVDVEAEGLTPEAVSLREITDVNRTAVTALRVAPGQEQFVASVARSLDEAVETPEGSPWIRAIYAGDEPVGFVMLSWNVTPAPGIIGPWFLWRLLIDERHQRRGYGRAALMLVVELVRAEGATELLTSYQPGMASRGRSIGGSDSSRPARWTAPRSSCGSISTGQRSRPRASGT